MISFSTQITLFNSVKKSEIMLFTKHLATMIKAGIPLVDALSALEEQAKQAYFTSIIKDIRKKVENGSKLADAMASHPKIFNSFYVNLIKISEKSGTLEENLGFISTQLTKSYRLNAKIKNAFLYPSMVITASFIMGTFITLFVLPQLVGFFSVMEVELPTSTKILLFVATVSESYGFLIIATILALLFSFSVLVKTRFVKPLWHNVLLHTPIIGSFMQVIIIAQFTRNLGILLKSGLPIAEAIDITKDTLTNEVYKKAVAHIRDGILSGKTIAQSITESYEKLFPTLVHKMIAVGEKTGNLDESLLYLGDFYEEELDTATKNLTTILEPALLIGIGLVVGFIALAIITPIYELTGSVRN